MTGRPPVVALSVGDPGGIGPEIALRLVAAGGLPARVLLLCDARALDRDRPLVPAAPPLARFPSPEAFAESGAPFGLDAEADDSGRRLRCTPVFGSRTPPGIEGPAPPGALRLIQAGHFCPVSLGRT